MIQRAKDAILEFRINIVTNRMLAEKDRTKQRDLAKQMAAIIKQRSPWQVARMERKAGLL